MSAALERAWREERAAVLATVARRLGDLGPAEDAVQEAFAAAAVAWARDGVPERPGAWLTTTAWRKALDATRRDHFPVPRQDVVEAAAIDVGTDHLPGAGPADLGGTEDAVLSLLLTCCHPALSPEAQVALTLRHVAGLDDATVAGMFLVPVPTMTKRLVRARAKIRDARISFALPDRTRLEERLAEVLAVIYLIFTEGHLSHGDGPAVRADLCDEALWLARQLHALVPDDAETTALLALLLLHTARGPARFSAGGRLVPWDGQDRSRWDAPALHEAKALLAGTSGVRPGPYGYEAAIALLHTTAAEADDVDWATVARLYDALARLSPSPVVEINRAVAHGRARGPEHGLAILAPVLSDARTAGYPPLYAAHADLLARAGDPAAEAAWRRAAALAPTAAVRDHLTGRADAVALRTPCMADPWRDVGSCPPPAPGPRQRRA